MPRSSYRLFLALMMLACTAAAYPGVAPLEQAEFLDDPSPVLPGDEANWQPLDLPDDWQQSHPASEGPAWYRLHFSAPASPDEPQGLYLPKINSNVAVFVNGTLLGDGGRFEQPVARNWNRPLYFAIPQPLLRPEGNVIHMRLAPKTRGYGFLGPVYAGPHHLLEPRFERVRLWKVAVAAAVFVLLFALSLFVGLLWLGRRRDTLYGWFAAGNLAWSFYVFDMIVRDLPVHGRTWDALVFSSLGWFVIWMTIFFHRFWNQQRPRLERFLLGAGVVGPAILFLLDEPYFFAFANFVWSTSLAALAIYLAYFIASQAVRRRGPEDWLLTVASLALVGFGVHDYLDQLGLLGAETARLMPLGAPLLLGVVGLMLRRRFIDSLEETESLNRDLEMRVQEKHVELERNYLRLQELERQKAIGEERERIMQEMHDGMGGHLVSTLAMVERGDYDGEAVATALHHALDDLRLMIDSLDPVEGDLVSVLAMLRDRLEPRLTESGIGLNWQVTDLPPISGLRPEHILHVLRILQEAITNAIKHARARTLTVHTGGAPDAEGEPGVYVQVDDDGVGIDDTSSPGRGMGNMQKRARLLGGRLRITSAKPGTSVWLWLPLTRESTQEELGAG